MEYPLFGQAGLLGEFTKTWMTLEAFREGSNESVTFIDVKD